MKRRRMTETQAEAIRADRAAGMTWAEIQRKHRRDPSMIAKALNGAVAGKVAHANAALARANGDHRVTISMGAETHTLLTAISRAGGCSVDELATRFVFDSLAAACKKLAGGGQ